jgi:hypothetical protein
VSVPCSNLFAGGLFPQHPHKLAHIFVLIMPGAAAHHISVSNTAFIHKRAAAQFNIELALGYGSQASA